MLIRISKEPLTGEWVSVPTGGPHKIIITLLTHQQPAISIGISIIIDSTLTLFMLDISFYYTHPLQIT